MDEPGPELCFTQPQLALSPQASSAESASAVVHPYQTSTVAASGQGASHLCLLPMLRGSQRRLACSSGLCLPHRADLLKAPCKDWTKNLHENYAKNWFLVSQEL